MLLTIHNIVAADIGVWINTEIMIQIPDYFQLTFRPLCSLSALVFHTVLYTRWLGVTAASHSALFCVNFMWMQ